ncbi:NADPH:quinone reductase-like Zn-dependent oxidoreductase [Pseudomonas sp. JUb42]|uniref:zinc-dependent alcohol dehydrogenase family protein n=1 Tax=Pseudomonas sp. JUb42 TaxID=2940611 RepID=UPI00216818E6|nr:zinc-dependent alcohol dehydrogenase family protein [Pseudomonas sp. JUb42]MCS3470178.1 NADPH:quinone reductase-like Zn-dependent oxidoreductase [Pseudomonas sp. JUb42]
MSQTTMHAAVAVQAEAPLQLQELPIPVPQAGQVLVKVMASGVNPLDTKISRGQGGHARQPLPAVLGMDMAGVVQALGAGVSAFKIGDEVYGMVGGIGGQQGSLAQYMAVDADLLARKPYNLSMREAAALPLIFITAWEGLVDRAKVQPGHRVLIHGGAGGVGHIAVQIAKAHGANVFATGSASSRETIEGFDATAIDYREQTPAQYMEQYSAGEGFDIVYDTVGGATLDASFSVAKVYTGHVVSCLGWGEHKLAPLSFRGATYSGVFTLLPLLTGKGRKHHGEIMAEATRMAEAGQLRVRLDDRRFTLNDVNDAYRVVAEGNAAGKVVVELQPSSERN